MERRQSILSKLSELKGQLKIIQPILRGTGHICGEDSHDKPDADLHSDQLRSLMQGAVELLTELHQESMVHMWLEDFAIHPKDYLLTIDDRLSVLPLRNGMALSESCASSKFDRYSNTNRDEFDFKILQLIQEQFPDKNVPVNILLMADDGLLQEFILLVKLMNLGYQNLQVHIVNSYHTRYLDTTLDERNFFHTVSNEEYKAIAESGELGLIRKNTQNSRRIFLKDIVKNHSEESRAFTETLQQYAAEKATGIRLTFHNNFNKFTEECAEAPTVCIALNYSSCNDSIREFVQLHQVLSPLGLMCVSDSENNHVFSKKQLCTPLSDPRDIQKHLPIHNKSELQIANLGATGFYHFLISVIFPYIQRHPDLKKVHLTLAHPQLAYFDGFEIRGSKHPSDGFTVEDVRYIASLVLSSEIEFTVNYITGYSKFSKLFPCVMSAPDLVVCFKKPNKHNLTGVVDDVKRMATQYPNANHYCGMRGSATETDPSFHVEWVWKHVTQECIILREEGENSPKKEEISEYYTQNKF